MTPDDIRTLIDYNYWARDRVLTSVAPLPAQYSLTVSKDFSGLVPSLAIVGTNADKNFYVPGGAANSTKFLGKTTVVAGLKYTF